MPDDPLGSVVIGNSAAMRGVMYLVHQVAPYPDTTVLLQGESGTGKDVIAHAIHNLSSRSAAPFLPLNCAAIPETLLETELFGVEAGAFTDAKVSRPGLLVRADKGTLFLDEIGSMPLTLQAKLLRFLETRTFLPVGSTKEQHVDLRVISATNVDLQLAVSHNTFREDLFYRLKVIPIYISPLRDRSEDIEPLASFFLQDINRLRREPLHISEEALDVMRCYPWPGNVRELRSAIEYASIFCDTNLVLPNDLPANVRQSPSSIAQHLQEILVQMHLPPEGIDLTDFLQSIEYAFIQESLAYCNGNQVRAAALLNISRDQLRYRLQGPKSK
jgi:two-component system NtrC family response regulator